MALSAWLIVLAAPAVASADVFTVNTPVDANDNVCEGIAARRLPAARRRQRRRQRRHHQRAGGHLRALEPFGGELLVDANMTIVGAGARQTIINANLGSRVMRVAPPVGTPAPVPVSASVSGVTLTKGSGVGGNNPNGGAVHVAFNATLTLTDSAVTNSDSQNGNGGGIYTDGNLTLNRVTVSGNEATGAAAPTNGGGIYHNSNNDPPRLLTITNSTISGNTTNGNGGGIYSAAGSLDLQSTTIAGNTAASGSGLFKPGSGTVIEDTIIAATGGTPRAPARASPRSPAATTWRPTRRAAVAAAGDPLLGALADNGGPTNTHALGSDEPGDRSRQPGSGPLHGNRSARGRSSAGRRLRHRRVRVRRRRSRRRQGLPPPVAGKNVNLLPKSGTVKVKLPGRRRFRELVRRRAAAGRDDRRHAQGPGDAGGRRRPDRPTSTPASSRSGRGRASKPRTTLTLTEKLSCPKAGKAIAAAKKKKRRLWGDGSGKFRTKGKHSAATVVGTKWLVEDRCKSTLTRVVRGRVSVRDFAKKKTVIVRAGKRYIARAG